MKGKKLLLPLAAFGLLVGLVGCNNNSRKSESNVKSSESQQPSSAQPSSAQPSSSSEAPVSSEISSEVPAESSEQPAESSEAPVESSEAPAESSEAPVESSEAPVESSSAAPIKMTVSAADNKKKIVLGESVQLTAAADGVAIEGVTWESKKPEVATVSETGLVTGVSKGSVQIVASKNGYTNATISITVELEKIAISSPEGVKKITGLAQTLQLSATLNEQPLEGVTWTSKNPEVATVSENGLVTSVAKGSTTITASKDPYQEATFALSVELEKIAVAAAENKTDLLKGETVQLSASLNEQPVGGLTWVSSDAEIASVSETGLVTANKIGSVTISAEKAGYDAGTVTINVVRPDPTIVLHMEDAEHYAADGEWSSSNEPTEAPTYNKSNASDGTTCAHFGAGDIETIRFSSDKAVKAEICLTVGYYYSLDDVTEILGVKFNGVDVVYPSQGYVAEDTSNYTYKPISFGELDLIAGTNVLEITMKENSSNRFPYIDDLQIYAVETATIALVAAPQKDPVVINQESITVAEGKTAAITSTMEGLSYKSASAAIATVDENGVVTGVKVGETTIAVSKDGYKTIRVPVTVTEAAGVIAVSINAGTSENDAVTFRTSRNLEEPYNYIVDEWPAEAVLTFTINAESAGTYSMYMRCRASGGYNSSTQDDLATCMEVQVNGTPVAASGTVSGSSFTDYLLGQVTLAAGENTVTIKCLTAVPTANVLRFIPQA